MKTLRELTNEILLLGILVMTLEIPLLASNITNADYYGTIVVSNNSTAATDISVNMSLDTDSLITTGILNSTANNCAIHNESGNDVAFMPGYNGSPWAIEVPSVGTQQSLNYVLYTGNVTGGKHRYFSGSNGMTTTDNETIEPSNNGSIAISGLVNTDSSAIGENLSYKEEGFFTMVTSAENVTSQVFKWVSPDGDDGGGGSWNNTGNGYDDNTATFADETIGAGVWGNYLTFSIPMPFFTDRIRFNATWVNGGIEHIDLDAYYDGGWQDVYQGTYTDATWITKKLTTGFEIVTQYRMRFENIGGVPNVARIYETDIGGGPSASATGISSGEYDIETTLYRDAWLDFDGATSSVQVADAASLDFANGFTIEAWVRTTDNDGVILSKWDATTDNRSYGLALSTVVGGTKLTLFLSDDGINSEGQKQTDAMTLDGDWHFYVAEYNFGAKQAYFYVDAVDAGTATFTVETGVIFNSTANVTLGDEQSGNIGQNLDGDIDEVRLYNGVLSSTDIATDFARGRVREPVPARSTNLQMWLPIDEETGTITYDKTAYNNDGTLVNATWDDESLKLWVDGTEVDSQKLSGNAIPNSAYDWVTAAAMAMPYMENYSVSVNGTTTENISWEYDSVFHDSSGYGNDATPTFRTTSSDNDVTATLYSFQPIEEATAGYVSENYTGEIVTTAPDEPATMYSENTTPGIFFAGLTNALLDAGNIPRTLFWFSWAFFIIIGAGMIIYKYSQSLLVKAIFMLALMIFFALPGPNIYGLWTAIYFICDASCILVLANRFGGIG